MTVPPVIAGALAALAAREIGTPCAEALGEVREIVVQAGRVTRR